MLHLLRCLPQAMLAISPSIAQPPCLPSIALQVVCGPKEGLFDLTQRAIRCSCEECRAASAGWLSLVSTHTKMHAATGWWCGR